MRPNMMTGRPSRMARGSREREIRRHSASNPGGYCRSKPHVAASRRRRHRLRPYKAYPDQPTTLRCPLPGQNDRHEGKYERDADGSHH